MDGSRLFLVRIGGDGGRFRAVARPVEQEQSQQFDQPLALLTYLLDVEAANRSSRPPSGQPSTPGEAA